MHVVGFDNEMSFLKLWMNYTNDLMMSSFCKTINSNVSLTSLISTLNDEFSMTVYCAGRNFNQNGFFKSY